MFAILATVMVAVGVYTYNTGIVMGEFVDRAWPGLLSLTQKMLNTHATPWIWDAVMVSMLSLAVWRFAFVLAALFAALAVISQLRRGPGLSRLI
jgi:hypothetical protein